MRSNALYIYIFNFSDFSIMRLWKEHKTVSLQNPDFGFLKQVSRNIFAILYGNFVFKFKKDLGCFRRTIILHIFGCFILVMSEDCTDSSILLTMCLLELNTWFLLWCLNLHGFIIVHTIARSVHLITFVILGCTQLFSKVSEITDFSCYGSVMPDGSPDEIKTISCRIQGQE